MNRAAALMALALIVPARAHAQTSPPRASIEGGVVIERLVSEYRFDNESQFTGGLVPHFFVQHYEATQPWLLVRARYPLGRGSGATTVEFAPARIASGFDVDTFFQPDGDVVTSGTAGDVRLSGFSIDQDVPMARVRGWTIGLDGRYTRRRADFLPADIVVTHTLPPSETRTFTTDREFTTSQEIRFGLHANASWRIGDGWRVEGAGQVWPTVRGRLSTELPEKYPGQTIVFNALSYGGEARVALVRRLGAARISVNGRAGGLLPYSHSASLRQHTVAAGVSVGFGGF